MKAITNSLFLTASIAVCSILSAAGAYAQDAIPNAETALSGPAGLIIIDSAKHYFCPNGASPCHEMSYNAISKDGTRVKVSYDFGALEKNEANGAAQLICKNGTTSDLNVLTPKALQNVKDDAKAGTYKIAQRPENRVITLALQGEDGTYVVVTQDKNSRDDNTLKLFTIKGDSVKEHSIKNVTRLRDGGTIWFDTEIGRVFSPAVISGTNQPSIAKNAARRLTESEAASLNGVVPGTKKPASAPTTVATPCV